MVRRGILPILAACALLAASACTDKPSPGAPDGGDAGPRVRDSGAEGGAAGGVDSGVDELALPPAVNEELLARMRHLLEAIVQNNPDLAGDVVFPRDGYVASRDTVDPQKAWEKRVSGLFKRSVERSHKRTKGIENAKFSSFELGHSILQLTPKKHDFKKPLWRVKHSKLAFTIDGKLRHFDIAEMTAWRGAWYVTRLR
ncbi:MAG TPA: hypothetical protein VLT33_31430 [Labilithrix sp.]|nr:hypothetical protein [Labilithrix sp.]